MLQKWLSQEWDELCQQAFGKLKNKLFSPLVLKFVDFDKPFEVFTGASDFAIGKVLRQDGWPLHMRACNSTVDKGDGQLMGNFFFVIVHYLEMC